MNDTGGIQAIGARGPAALARIGGSAVLVALLVAALVVPAGCGSEPAPASPASAAPAPQVTVALGLYSGRPDPSWELEPAQATILVRMLDSLPVVTAEPPEGGLGFHGFLLSLRDEGRAEQQLVAYRGAIAAPGTGARPVRSDPARTVERFLLQTGRAHLAPAEAAAAEADLAGP